MKHLFWSSLLISMTLSTGIEAQEKSKVKYKVDRVEIPVPVTTVKDIGGFTEKEWK